MTNDEIIRFLLESQASIDSQLSRVVATMDRITASMSEWHEDRAQMHRTMHEVFARMDKFATEAAERDKAADARMRRLENLFGRLIDRDRNGGQS